MVTMVADSSSDQIAAAGDEGNEAMDQDNQESYRGMDPKLFNGLIIIVAI